MTRRLRALVAVSACVVLAACGSQVPPNKFFGAQGSLAGNNRRAEAATVLDGTGGGGSASAATPSPGAGSTGTTSPGGSGGAGVGGAAAGGGSGGGSRPAGSGGAAGSCAGFQNGTGVTDSTITIANVSDLTGPVPGLFRSAQAAVTAYVAYFNATSSICGRKLKVLNLDSATSESGDQQADTTACGSAFAQIGSMGAFDAGGAATAAACGIPDIRAASTETARYKSPTSFGAYSLAVPEVPT
ncbi:MAG: hypothetical protein EPN43_14630, partial [Jatrophihabitans sp.]